MPDYTADIQEILSTVDTSYATFYGPPTVEALRTFFRECVAEGTWANLDESDGLDDITPFVMIRELRKVYGIPRKERVAS